jgi:hypothetical protein
MIKNRVLSIPYGEAIDSGKLKVEIDKGLIMENCFNIEAIGK